MAPDVCDVILRSHLIEPATLRADDFEAFWKARKAALAGLAAKAQEGDIAWGIVLSAPCGVFVKGDVESPVELVFYGPVGAGDGKEAVGEAVGGERGGEQEVADGGLFTATRR